MAHPPVPPSLSGDLAITGGRTWIDRVTPAAYKSPSGKRFEFAFEAVSRETEKRGTVFGFPGVDGGYVQDTGISERQYPMVCYFWGDNHDRIATAFEAALFEPGTGKLEHPLYGPIDAVPFGKIGRRNDLVNEANQSVVEVTFFTTIGALYPTGQSDPRNEVLVSLDDFDAAAAQQFVEATDLTTTVSRANEANDVQSFLNDVSGSLTEVSRATSDVNREFRAVQREINLGIDVLVGQPLQLANQLVNLITLPSRALAGIASRLAAYASLADKISVKATRAIDVDAENLPSLLLRQRNLFHTADLMVMTAVTGTVRSVLETVFRTRNEALQAAAEILALLDAVVEWREATFTALDQVDTGASYQALQTAVATVAGYLVEISFSLLPERRITLDRARTIIDLAAELYGSVDDKLDLLINSNQLSGSEILELPAGRTIVYY